MAGLYTSKALSKVAHESESAPSVTIRAGLKRATSVAKRHALQHLAYAWAEARTNRMKRTAACCIEWGKAGLSGVVG